MKNRPSTTLLIIDSVLAALFIFAVVYLFEIKGNSIVFSQNLSQEASSSQQIEPLSLLYAVTPEQQELGLGNRASLPADEGMLFIFGTPGEYGFWMKDMQFPIDMIWMDNNFQITHIESNVSPDTYPQSFSPTLPSSYVLETNAGYAQNNNLSVGETLDFVRNSLQNTQ